MPLEAPELVSKQEWDRPYVSMDFSNVLSGSKVITLIDSIRSEKRGGGESDLIIESETISADGKSVEFYINGGTRFYTYRIEVRIYADTERFEGDGLLEVVD